MGGKRKHILCAVQHRNINVRPFFKAFVYLLTFCTGGKELLYVAFVHHNLSGTAQ